MHTPGPWTYKEITSDLGGEIISADGCVARTWWVRHPEGTPVPTNANGLLIAAATDLLAALKAFYDGECHCAEIDPKVRPCVMCCAGVAIAKAEGRKP
jgi:hypothetical protein